MYEPGSTNLLQRGWWDLKKLHIELFSLWQMLANAQKMMWPRLLILCCPNWTIRKKKGLACTRRCIKRGKCVPSQAGWPPWKWSHSHPPIPQTSWQFSGASLQLLPFSTYSIPDCLPSTSFQL